MWFALFDEEFTKASFLTEPKHYWIGLANQYYTFKLLTWNVIKAIFNGLLITLFVFITLNGYAIAAEGYGGSFWASGAIVYGMVVINANLWILQRTSSHTIWSSLLIAISILSYFLCFWLENLFPFSGPLYRSFGQTIWDGRAWLVIILSLW